MDPSNSHNYYPPPTQQQHVTTSAPPPPSHAPTSAAVAPYNLQQQQQRQGNLHHPQTAGAALNQHQLQHSVAASVDPNRPPGAGDEYEEIREQDRYLPIANISRIMKNQLPENAKIAKDSKETVQECVSEFVSFITSEASDKCMQEKRKTINGDDLLWAMSTLGFDKYVEPLKVYLAKYREAARGDKPGAGGGTTAGGKGNHGAHGVGGSGLGRPPARAAAAGEGVGVPTAQQPPHKRTKMQY